MKGRFGSAGRAVIFAGGIAFAPLVQAANLLVNGGFEAPLLPSNTPKLYGPGTEVTGWEVFGAGDVAVLNGSFSQAGLTFTHDEGVQSLDLTGLSNVATGVRQSIATVAGLSYALEFAVGNVRSTGPVWGTVSSVQVLLNGQPFAVASNAGGPSDRLGWQKFNYTFVATGSSTEIAFLNLDDEADNVNQIDSVNLAAAVPEPAGSALLAAGGLVLLLKQRRRFVPRVQNKK